MGGPVVSASANFLEGTMLGKDYRVLEPIGMGGMAVVYLVEHQTLQKRFAAKVLSTELGRSVEARVRFTEEAHAASQLDHENIVTISDFGVTVDQRPYFVMELLRGQTLDQRLGDGPMTLEEVVAVSVPVARALAHAHAEGIVHRDVKPENIFLVQRSQGRWGVKVVDFGIAKTPHNAYLSKPGETLGSPLFMAPEMCLGADVDQRADVYAFGVLLYLMLCGRVPFDDLSLERVMQMHVSDPPPAPRLVNQLLSPELEAVVLRALQKDQEVRYPSMDALLIELEAALPPDSDRLLIEAQSGTSLRSTPFPNTLSLATPISQRFARASQPPPMESPPPPSQFPADEHTEILPRRSLRKTLVLLGLGVIGMLAAGAVGFELFQRSKQQDAAPIAMAITPPTDHLIGTPPHEVEISPTPAEATTHNNGASPTPPEVATPPVASAEHSPRPVPRSIIRNGAKRSVKSPLVERLPHAVVETTVPAITTDEVAPIAELPHHDVLPPPPPVEVTPPPLPAKPLPTVGSLDATPTITSLDVRGSLPGSMVRRQLERTLSSFRACYRSAAKVVQATPPVDVSLFFEIDENSSASNVSVSGTSFGSLGSCVTSVASQIRTQQAPDVGSVHVTATIRFRPT